MMDPLNVHSVLRNLADVSFKTPPQQFTMKTPPLALALPKYGPFKIAMCNMPSCPTAEEIESYWANYFRQFSDGSDEWEKKNKHVTEIEIPLKGMAGYVIVQLKNRDALESALQCKDDWISRGTRRTIFIRLAGGEWLSNSGCCILAADVERRRKEKFKELEKAAKASSATHQNKPKGGGNKTKNNRKTANKNNSKKGGKRRK